MEKRTKKLFCGLYGLGICLATSDNRGATSSLIGHKSENDFNGSQRKKRWAMYKIVTNNFKSLFYKLINNNN